MLISNRWKRYGIRAHLEMQIEENLRQGMSPDEARYQALRKFGGVEQVKESYRDRRSLAVVDEPLRNIRYALPMLSRSPGFTAVAVLTLALGIGANTAIFSMFEGVVLAPLPYREAERLVVVWHSDLQVPTRIPPSVPDFQDWQRNARSFEQMVAIEFTARDLTSPGPPAHLSGRKISSGFFSMLGVNLSLGREFSPQEDQRAGNPVVIISNRLWQDRFGGGREVLGRSVTLNGINHTIVGVLPSGFEFVRSGETSALILGRILSNFSRLLYGVQPGDPLTLIAISLVLIGTTLLASSIPARRAAGIDPMIALRHE